jgi:hypothetical protein
VLSIQERDLARRLHELAVGIAVPPAPPLRRASTGNAVAIGQAIAAVIIVALLATVAFVGLRGTRVTPASTPAATPPVPSLASPASLACPACRYDDGSGSFRLDGVVRDTSGAPVAGARVAIYYNQRLASAVATATTDEAGTYALTYELSRLPAGQFWGAAYLVAEKAGYETDGLGPGVFTRSVTYLTRPADDMVSRRIDLRLHPTVALAAGGSAHLVIRPDDPICAQWFMDKDEWPCRIVRVTSPAAGRIAVDVTWIDSANELGLQLLPQSFIGLRQDPPCCGRHESIDVREGEVLEVQVLFLNEGYFARHRISPSGALPAARGAQSFDVSTSFTPK